MRVRGISIFLLCLGTLSGCSLPAPYQTYSPGTVPAPSRAGSALPVYGTTTSSPDMAMDFGEVAPVPAPSPAAAPNTAEQGVAICYNRLWNSAAAVRDAAAQACGAHTAPRVVRQNLNLDACPVMVPTHAVFACDAAPGRNQK